MNNNILFSALADENLQQLSAFHRKRSMVNEYNVRNKNRIK